MTSPAPNGDPLPPADVFRLHDFYQHAGAALVLLAKGGRVHGHHPQLAAAVSRRARRLLKPLSALLAVLKEGPADHDVPPAAGDRQE